MVLEDLFAPFLPVHHPSSHISTRPYSFLPVQMMGGQVSTQSYGKTLPAVSTWRCSAAVALLPGSAATGRGSAASGEGRHLVDTTHNTIHKHPAWQQSQSTLVWLILTPHENKHTQLQHNSSLVKKRTSHYTTFDITATMKLTDLVTARCIGT